MDRTLGIASKQTIKKPAPTRTSLTNEIGHTVPSVQESQWVSHVIAVVESPDSPRTGLSCLSSSSALTYVQEHNLHLSLIHCLYHRSFSVRHDSGEVQRIFLAGTAHVCELSVANFNFGYGGL